MAWILGAIAFTAGVGLGALAAGELRVALGAGVILFMEMLTALFYSAKGAGDYDCND